MPPALAPNTPLSFSSLPTQGPSFPLPSANLVTHIELGDAAVGMLSFLEAFTFPKLLKARRLPSLKVCQHLGPSGVLPASSPFPGGKRFAVTSRKLLLLP